MIEQFAERQTRMEACARLQKMQGDIDDMQAKFSEIHLPFWALGVAWQAVRVAWYVMNQDNDGGKLVFLLKALADYRGRQKESDRAQSIGKKARKA